MMHRHWRKTGLASLILCGSLLAGLPARAADPTAPAPAEPAKPEAPPAAPPTPEPPAPPAPPEPTPPPVPTQTTVEDADARAASVDALKKLSKQIPVKLENIPIRDALAHLSEQAEIDIFPEWKSMEAAEVGADTPVNVVLNRPASIEQILSLVLRSAAGPKLVWTIDNGLVTVTTADAIAHRVVVRSYDVSDLLEKNEDPTELILAVIAPGTWHDFGGEVGVLRLFNGKLLVTHTEPVQRQIEKLLKVAREPAPGKSKAATPTAKP